MTNIQEKRNSLELAAFFRSDLAPEARGAIVQMFEGELAGYLVQLLDASLELDQAMWIRAKAIGLVETLTRMGQHIDHASDALTKPTKKVVGEALGLNRY